MLFLTGVTSLQAQGTLTAAPNPVFFAAPFGGGPQQQAIAISSSPASVPFTAAVQGTGTPWLTISASAATTPATLTVSVNPGLIPAGGVYAGVIQLSSASAPSVLVEVVLTVSAPSPLTSNVPNLIFTYQQGTAAPPAQNITIGGTGAVPFTMSGNTTWLLVPSGGTTPATVSVAVNPAGLAAGIYVGTVQALPTGGGQPAYVPVVLTVVSSPIVGATPTSLAFFYQVGGTNPTTQKTVALSNAGGSIPFTVTATVAAGIPQWLSVTPTSGNTPATLTVTISPAALPPGTYQGKVTMSSAAAANPTLDIPVTLTVGTQQFLDVNLNSAIFFFQVGGPTPPAQTVTPTSTGQPLVYSVTTATTGNVPWLSATPTGITPNPITITASPQGLPPGNYSGTVSISGQNASGAAVNNPQVISVSLVVTNNPTLSASPSPLVFNYQVGQALPGPQSVAVTSTGASPLSFTIAPAVTKTANNINWLLTGTPSSTTTPANFAVSVSPAGLPADVYTGTLTLNAPGASSQVTVPVTLNVSTNPLLNVTPVALAFNAQAGNPTSSVQTVTVTTTSDPVPYTVSFPSSVGWLFVGNPTPPIASAAQPSTFFVTVVATSLTTGVYNTNITVHPSNGAPDVIIAVTLTVSAGNLGVSPATLNFTQVTGASPPASQTVNVTSTAGAALPFNAFASATSWLTVTQSATITPGTLTVSVNSGTLQPGNYTGTINVISSAAGNSPQTVTVNLTVAPPQNLVAQPAALTFTSQVGSPAPVAQTVAVTASTGTFPFTAAANVPAGQTWLSVSPPSGTASTTPTNLTVTVNPQNLQPGTYTGTVAITSPSASNSPQTINVTYTVTAIPSPLPTSIVNAGSNVPGAIAPGEVITIYGNNIGPPTPASGAANASGFFETTLSDTRVLFDGIPSPLTYVSSGQINAVVPYEIAGRASTTLVVQYKNTPSSSISLRVADSAPGIFVLNVAGQGAILNQNGTVNGVANPAQKDSIVVIYATGEGSTNPPGTTGLRIPADGSVLKRPLLPLSVTIGGRTAEVLYAGSAPGLISGALQINVRVPLDAPSSGAVPVVLTVGSSSSQGLATVALQ
jgi:uncharacterized protein (TIGR03437 family)